MGFPIPENHPARARRKEMIVQAQEVLDALEFASKRWSLGTPLQVVNADQRIVLPASSIAHDPNTDLPLPPAMEHTPSLTSLHSQSSTVPSPSPPPYSPTSPSSIASSTTTKLSVPGTPVVRRKAPPPPKKFIAAKALFDFEPEVDNDEELAFKEGDAIEIIEKTAALEEEGWCRARFKGQKKLGLVPLEYLEIEEKATTAHKPPLPAPSPDLNSTSALQPTTAGIDQQSSSLFQGQPITGGVIASTTSPHASLPFHSAGQAASPYPAAYSGIG